MNSSMPPSPICRLLGDDRGSMLSILAVVVAMAVMGAALAVDLARAQALHQQLQLTADAAALAAAVNLPDIDAARAAAYRYAARNLPDHQGAITSDDIAFGHWDPETRTLEADMSAPSAVRVTPSLSKTKGNALSTLFAGMLGTTMMDLAASAVAGKRSPMCILTLEPNKADALGMDWFAEIEAMNCTVQVNSRHKWAFRLFSGSRFTAGGLCVAGGAYVSMLGNSSPEPTTGCPPQPDPLADLSPPEIGGCDYSNKILNGFHGTLQPGVYCGGLIISGASSVDLAPGVYVIKDGPFMIGDSSEISGDGVTFYLTGTQALIRFHDQSQLTLMAPTEGDLAGILVYQDRNFGGDHIWDSKAPTTLHGTIYFPKARLVSQSSNAITPVNSCNVLIAEQIRLMYKSAVSIDLGQKHCQQYLPSAVLGTVALLD